MNNDNEYNILSISSPKSGKRPFTIEKIKKSKYKKNKAHQIFHEKINNQISNKRNKKLRDFDKFLIMNNQLQKYNSNPEQKNIMIINDIIETKTNHFLAVFKDFLITDYVDEFLKRYFTIDECEELIPKFFLYYKNYLKFFCRGFFIDFKANKIIQDNGEFQAELYYNNNYGGKDNRKGKKVNEEKISRYSGDESKSKSKSETTQENKNNNTNISKINKIKLIFSKSIRNKLGGSESSRIQEKKELSNIFYKNKNETITLNDETKVYNEDNMFTNENSLINLLNILINKKLKRKKNNENKIAKNNINEKNIVNIYKNLLSQSPIKSARYQNYIKNGIYNKTSKKISSIKIFNKNIPIILKNKNHNLSNEMKTPFLEKTKMASRNNHSRNSRTNFSSRANNSTNIFVRNSKSKKSHKKRKNNSKSILTRLNMGSLGYKKSNKSKYSTFNKNIINKKRKKSIYTGYYFKNMSNNSSSSSRNLKKNFIYSFHSNNNNINSNNNNPKVNNKIKNYQYMTFKSKASNKHKMQNKICKSKQNWSLSNSNSIYNNFHININNNIMLLNNNNSNIKHFISNKNNMKSSSKNKKNNNTSNMTNNINNFNYKRNNKNINSRNENNVDINKYKTEIKNFQVNLKKKNSNYNKNFCSSIKKFMALEKSKSKNKDKSLKNKEQLVRNKSNLYYNNSRLKNKKFDKSDMMPSLKNFKKLNNSNKNLNVQSGQKINIIFDYKKK